jgi:hypothetical protein
LAMPAANHPADRWYRVTRICEHLSDEIDAADIAQVQKYFRFLMRNFQRDKLPVYRDPVWENLQVSFDEKRVRAAVYTRARDKSGELDDWTHLPAKVGVEVFRDLLAEWSVDEIYSTDKAKVNPLKDVIKPGFQKMMRNRGILSFRIIRNKRGPKLEAHAEYPERVLYFSPVHELRLTPDPKDRVTKVLRERGIKVVYANFSTLEPVNGEIYQQRLNNWQAVWEKQYEITRGEVEQKAILARSEIIREAQRDIVAYLVDAMKQTTYSEEALAMWVFQGLEVAAADPEIRKLLPKDTMEILSNLRNWMT